MSGLYASPVAPAVALLLSAFILSIVLPRLPAERLAYRGLYYFIGPGLVGLTLLILFSVGLTLGEATIELLHWDFFTPEAGVVLLVQARDIHLIFLLMVLLTLMVLALLDLPHTLTFNALRDSAITPKTLGQWQHLSGWFMIGAGACLVYVAADPLAIVCGLFLFDGLLAVYWLRRGQNGLGVARLFLGALTASVLIVTSIPVSDNVSLNVWLIGLALWLRLGVYPFIEIASSALRHFLWSQDTARQPDDGLPAYLTLSLPVGAYLAAQTLAGPLPNIFGWLTLIIIVLNGLLAWLEDQPLLSLIHLIQVNFLLILLTAPLEATIIAAYTAGLTLSFIVFWATPRLGRPDLPKRAEIWFYLPAFAATLTLIGLPFSLGWATRLTIHTQLLWLDSFFFILLTILAQALAFSGLMRYWLMPRPPGPHEKSPAIGFVALTPFLVPGLAPFIFSAITGNDLTVSLTESIPGLMMMVLVIIGAIALGYYKENLLTRLQISAQALKAFIYLGWLVSKIGLWLDQTGKWVLRVNVILEGQHYLGWAIFAAIVGTLIILLRV